MGSWVTFIAVFAVILVVGLFTYFVPVIHWYVASSAGLRISIVELVTWRMRKLPVDSMVEAMIRAKQYRVPLSKEDILRYSKEGRDMANVVTGLIAARQEGFDLDLEKALLADRKGIIIEQGIRQLSDKKRNRERPS